MTRLKVLNLSVRRGDELLIDRLSFEIAAGEALVVTGRNGSGKSTLIRTIAGMIAADGGSVALSVGGQAIARAAEGCHYLGHRNAMKREMTVRENLAFWRDFLGDHPAPETAQDPAKNQASRPGRMGLDPDEAAERLGLGAISHLPFGYLSAGQQRRMAMAKLLVAWRPVWLLDEPTAALDAEAEALFAGIVNAHLAAGGLALVATHQPLAIEPARRLVMAGFSHADAEAF